MANESRVWDSVVVGGGVMGSWTAYHLTKAGYRTLLIDQFALPHTRGSSHGQSRLIRRAYSEENYTEMSEECYGLWMQLAEETNRQLFKNTGIVIVGDENSSNLQTARGGVIKYPDLGEYLNKDELTRRYPMLHLPDHVFGVVDNTAGLLQVNTCMQALWDIIRKNGGTIQDGTQVQRLEPATNPVRLFTNKGTILSKHVILTPGPWASDLLHKVGLTLPLKTLNGYGIYLRDHTGGHSIDAGCPIILDYTQDDEKGYRFCAMFPSMEYPGLVKMVTRGEPPPSYCHPDERDSGDMQGYTVTFIKNYIKDRLPGLHPEPSIIEPCVYTMTPDKHFIIDQHPRYKNILIGAGGSGNAFIRSPVIGKLLCEMVQEKPTSYEIKPFRISRFNTSRL